MEDLSFHLGPLCLVVQQEKLYLPDKFLLTLVNRLLLHLEGTLDIPKEQICVFQLLVCLFCPRFDHPNK